MSALSEHIHQKLIERIRQPLAAHRTDPSGTCSCGAEGVSDHPRHVAEKIIEALGLKADGVDEVKKQIRYAGAWLDLELTTLEGAEI
jgi:hypothetical protein